MQSDVIPPILYRYRKWDKESEGFGSAILTQCIAYFASPKKINDPFDCNLGIGTENKSHDQIREKIREVVKLNGCDPGPTLAEFNQDPEGWIENQRKIGRDGLEKESGVLCLSVDPANIIMWSHYADCHRGFCVGIDAQQVVAHFKSKSPGSIIMDCINVRYQRVLPILEPLEIDDPEWAKQQFRYKFIDWAYEQEYRMVMIKYPELAQACRNVPLDAIAIREVILGCQMTEEDETDIKTAVGALRADNPTIKLFKAVKCKTEFALDIIPEPLD